MSKILACSLGPSMNCCCWSWSTLASILCCWSWSTLASIPSMALVSPTFVWSSPYKAAPTTKYVHHWALQRDMVYMFLDCSRDDTCSPRGIAVIYGLHVYCVVPWSSCLRPTLCVCTVLRLSWQSIVVLESCAVPSQTVGRAVPRYVDMIDYIHTYAEAHPHWGKSLSQRSKLACELKILGEILGAT